MLDAKMVARLKDPSLRPRLKKDILNGLPNWYNHYLAVGGDWSAMLLVNLKAPKNKPFIGGKLHDLARREQWPRSLLSAHHYIGKPGC